jgi:hypothetical protein
MPSASPPTSVVFDPLAYIHADTGCRSHAEILPHTLVEFALWVTINSKILLDHHPLTTLRLYRHYPESEGPLYEIGGRHPPVLGTCHFAVLLADSIGDD